MPHFDELYPGRFLKATTLDAPTVIRIVRMGGETLAGDDGERAKGVLTYKSAKGDGEIVWCKTNAILTAKALGTDDYTQWAGRLLTIWNDPSVMFGGERVGGVRVYGSPELTATKRVEIKRPRRKKPDVFTLKATDKQGRDLGSKPAPHSMDSTDLDEHPPREPGDDQETA